MATVKFVEPENNSFSINHIIRKKLNAKADSYYISVVIVWLKYIAI